jgi:hypothetical protein
MWPVVPGGWCTISLEAHPAAGGARNAVVEIYSDDPDESVYYAPLVVNGTVPDINAVPSPLDFGNVGVGNTVLATLTVQNLGEYDMWVSNYFINGTHASEFIITWDTCVGGPVSPGGSCWVDLDVTPAAAGTRNAVLEITSDDPDESVYYAPLVVNYIPLDPPTGITLSNMKSAGPLISWNAVADATSYNIYRSTDDTNWTVVGSVSHPTTSWRDTTAPKFNTPYFWTVTAEDGLGESSKPAGVLGRTALIKGWNIVSAPKATSGSATQVFGSWAYWSWYWNSTYPVPNNDPDKDGTWTKNPSVVPGKSLFVWAWNNSTVLSASGGANPAFVDITLVPGWNIVSNQTDTNTDIKTNWTVSGETLATAIGNGWIGNSLYWWDGSTWQFPNIMDDPTVEPWKGYYILNDSLINRTLRIQ